MRLLQLISTLALGTALTLDSSQVLASPKAHIHQQLKIGLLARHAKVKLHASNLKEINPGDVWHRISDGIRLPRPSLAAINHTDMLLANAISPPNPSIQGSSLSTKANPALADDHKVPEPEAFREADLDTDSQGFVKPFKAHAAEDKYTPLGRKLLASKRAHAGDCDPSKSMASHRNYLTPGNARIHTQLNFHPELNKHSPFAAKYGKSPSQYQSDTDEKPCTESISSKFAHIDRATAALNHKNVEKTLETQLQLLARKQRLQENRSNLQLAQIDPSQSSQTFDTRMQLWDGKTREQLEQQRAKLSDSYERVNKFINWYAQRRGYLQDVAERARPYVYHVVETLNKHQLPLDLALLPIVESAYQPTALSPKSAAGLWQFIPSTGSDYNLQQNERYDDRLDIVRSTKAAANFLKFLNQRYHGDWLLAIAAYNCGPGRVDDAIASNAAAGLDTDFWSLELPQETKDYVPRLLALSALFSNPGNYNLKLAPVRNEPHFIDVKIDRETDLKNLIGKEFKTIAELAGIDYEHFSKLNPGYLGPVLAENGPYSFLLPIPNANILYQQLNSFATVADNKRQVNPSEDFIAKPISKATKPDLLAEQSNPLISLELGPTAPLKLLKPAETANKPKQPSTDSKSSLAQASKNNYLRIHFLDRGENLQSLALKYEVSVDAIRQLNKLKRKQTPQLGQQLLIPHKIPSVMLGGNEMSSEKITKG